MFGNAKLLILSSVFLHHGMLVNTNGKQEIKRILLTDPNVVQQNLLLLEGKIQNLTAQVMFGQSVAENKMRALETENAALKQSLNILTTSRLPAAEKEIQTLKLENSALTQSVKSLTDYQSQDGGAMYVRWGRKTCPDNETEMVYSGFSGGSKYDQYGSAAEYVCLPPDPLWNSNTDTTLDRNGRMYGAEYESGFFGHYHAGLDDVPCVVCRSTSRKTTLMLPARNQCYPGWKQEYSGNLASGAESHQAASQFVCVDGSPEVLIHGEADNNGKLFYAVEGVCGSLPCPPYENGRELSCVVCTK